MKYLKYKAKLQKLQSGGGSLNPTVQGLRDELLNPNKQQAQQQSQQQAAAGAGAAAPFQNPLLVMSLLGNGETWNAAGLNNLPHAVVIAQMLQDLVKSPNMFNTNDLSSQLILLNGLFDKGVKYELPDTLFQQLMLGLKVYPIINGEHAHEHIHEDKGVLMQHKHVHEHKRTKNGEFGIAHKHEHDKNQIHELSMISPNGYGFLMHVLGENFSGSGKNRKEVDFLSAMHMMNLINPRNSKGTILSNDILENMLLINSFNHGFRGGGKRFTFDRMFSGFNGIPLMLYLLGNQNSELVNIAAIMGVGNLWKNPEGNVETAELETFFSYLMQLKMFDLLNVSNPNMMNLMLMSDNMNPFKNSEFNVMLEPLMKLGLVKSLTGSNNLLPFKFNTNLLDSVKPLILMNMIGGDKTLNELNELNDLIETMELAEIAKKSKKSQFSPYVAKLLKMGKQHFNMFLVDRTLDKMETLRVNDDGLIQSLKEYFTPGVMLAQTNILNEQEYFIASLMMQMFGYEPFNRQFDDNIAWRMKLGEMSFGNL